MMTSNNVELQLERVDDVKSRRRADRLVLVVGFDGSKSAIRALDAAALLIAGRLGTIEVVFVAQMPTGAEMVPGGHTASLTAFASAEIELSSAVRNRLADVEDCWHFRRRDGLIAHELMAVADELSRDYGNDADVVIVVGRALHTLHHVVGSIPVALVRHAQYPVVVVP
jgi:nucleotide-binding universal stress UspA family protein